MKESTKQKAVSIFLFVWVFISMVTMTVLQQYDIRDEDIARWFRTMRHRAKNIRR